MILNRHTSKGSQSLCAPGAKKAIEYFDDLYYQDIEAFEKNALGKSIPVAFDKRTEDLRIVEIDNNSMILRYALYILKKCIKLKSLSICLKYKKRIPKYAF